MATLGGLSSLTYLRMLCGGVKSSSSSTPQSLSRSPSPPPLSISVHTAPLNGTPAPEVRADPALLAAFSLYESTGDEAELMDTLARLARR